MQGSPVRLPAPSSTPTGSFGTDPNAIPASVLGDSNYVKKGYSGNANAPVAPVSIPQGSFGPDPNMPLFPQVLQNMYRHSTHQNDFAEDDAWVTTCSMAGPESHVVIATLVSSTWEKRVCGEELPESRFRYLIDVSTPILDAKKGRMELLGQQHFEWLPKKAQSGDKFLIAYRTERGHNFLLQCVEILEGEVNVEDKHATLPSNSDELVAAIQQQQRLKCSTKYVGFTLPFDNFIRPWNHKVCGGSVDPIQEPLISNGVDL